jgi:multiple sugar transport system permease protein
MAASSAESVREPRGKIVAYVLLGILVSLVFLVPLLWAVLRAFQPNDTIVTDASWSQMFHLTWGNFAEILSPQGTLWRSLINSIIVSVGSALLAAVLAALAGYGLSKFHFRGSGVAFAVILLSMMVPFQALLTPLYLEMNTLGLTDSLLGLVLFYATMNLPFGVFVMRATCDAIPDSLEDAALVDGAGTLRMMVEVLRPFLVPGMASAGLYAFLRAWTEFLGALAFITKENLYTLPIALLNLQTGSMGEVDYGLLVAGAVVAMIPSIILYVALQKFYVQGLAAGAVKG